MAMLWLFHRSSMCRPGHCALMRSELLDLTTIISATACHQSNYVEPYSRFIRCGNDKYKSCMSITTHSGHFRSSYNLGLSSPGRGQSRHIVVLKSSLKRDTG